ncbi:MAG: hypothetical protein PVSMB11_07740 [Desulfuromonadaceae bacterium]
MAWRADQIRVGVKTVQTLPVYQGEKRYIVRLECAEALQGGIMEGNVFNG